MAGVGRTDDSGMEPGRDYRREELWTTERSLYDWNVVGALLGITAAALAVLGLANVLPVYLAAIACIAIGAALLVDSAGGALRYQRLAVLATARDFEQAQVSGGLTIEALSGVGGVALGVLTLVGLAPSVLLSVAALVYGAAFLMSGGVPLALETWVERSEPSVGVEPRRGRVAHQAVNAASGARALAGIAAAVLGLLGLASVGPALTLTLVAFLALGGAAILSGSAFSVRMGTLMEHHR